MGHYDTLPYGTAKTKQEASELWTAHVKACDECKDKGRPCAAEGAALWNRWIDFWSGRA